MKPPVRILLAEDNPPNQKLIQILLTKAGHRVDTAINGREVVEKYSSSPDSYDLILMDIIMPEMDGIEAAREIRQWELSAHQKSPLGKLLKSRGKDRKIPIIALTANVEEKDIAACLKAGMNDCLPKPIQKESMLTTIDKWIEQK